MKKILCFILAVCALLSLAGCSGGVVLDENEVIENNGTSSVTKGGSVYQNDGGCITKDGEELAVLENVTDDRLFALGEYLYVNTEEGAMQIAVATSKVRKFGNGEIIGAFGRWVYYQSEDNKVGNMIVYKIDMKEGRQLNIFQDTIIEVKEIEDDVIYFKGISGNEYINEVNDDNGYFYNEWLGEDVTEATE